MRRHPALDGVADILAAGDEDGEEHEQRDGVQVVEAVHPVVVVLRDELGVAGGPEQRGDPAGTRGPVRGYGLIFI